MTGTRFSVTIVVALAIAAVAGCATLTGENSRPLRHPVPLKGKHVTCTECHDGDGEIPGIGKRYAAFNHSPVYYKDHAEYAIAGNNGDLCNMCHASSFCIDCHSTNPSQSPNITSNVEFEFSHRGDYLTRHEQDGRADPASCYGCHGRSNNRMCRECHRK